MDRLVIPEAFFRVCSHFHQDTMVVYGTLEAAVEAAAQSVAGTDRETVRCFLDKVLATGNASDAKHVLRRAATEIRFGRAAGARAMLQMLRDAIGDGTTG